MQSTAATVLEMFYDVILSVDHPQVFSPLQSKDSTTSASPAIITQLSQWDCGWWRTESRWLQCTTIQLETATRQQPMAWLCSLKRETRCAWDSGRTPGLLIISTATAPSLAICYSLCEWNQEKIRKSLWKQVKKSNQSFHVNNDCGKWNMYIHWSLMIKWYKMDIPLIPGKCIFNHIMFALLKLLI